MQRVKGLNYRWLCLDSKTREATIPKIHTPRLRELCLDSKTREATMAIVLE